MRNVHHKRNVNHLPNVRTYNTYYQDGENYDWSNLHIKNKTFRFY